MSKNRTEEQLGSAARAVGSYTLDQALDAGLLKGAVSYHPSGRAMCWVLRYDDGQVGRAIVSCYGFELLTLGLSHRRQDHAARVARGDTSRWSPPVQRRPAKWRDAS